MDGRVLPCRGERLVEQDDPPEKAGRCKKCGAKLRQAPDCYRYDRRSRRYALEAGVTAEEERASGWTCGRCGWWHEHRDIR
jgi:hypothetical protein